MSKPPSRIGSYRVVRVLGEGGMGTVYEAVHEGIGRRVAVKVLHPEYARKPEIVQRFLNEARAVNVVSHPGLVQISECAQTEDGTVYLVMEYLDGETLGARLQRSGGKLSEAKAVRFLRQLADVLFAAHASGIVHRDLKPGNVMLVRDPSVPGGERVKLVDFGIAKLGQQLGQTDGVRTKTGVMMGTPVYMAPEQCLGATSIDGKADVYSLGVMMFEMLAGEPPFAAEVDLALLNMHLTKAPPPLQKFAPAASAAIAKLAKRMLSKPAGERPTMGDVARLLQAQEAALPQEPEPAFDPEDLGETRLLPSDSATFRSGGERLTIGGRRRPLAAFSAGLGLITVVGLAVWIPNRNKPPAPGIMPSGRAEALPTPRPVAQPEPNLPLGPPARRAVLLLKSHPGGAAVVRSADGQVLGSTPWRQEKPALAGDLALELRLPGYRPRSITMRLDQDSERNEVLIAEPRPQKVWHSVPKAVAVGGKPEQAAKVAAPLKTPKGKTHDAASRIID